ncbi:PAS domain S-box protein [Rhodoferax lacus]|nr:PAS domain S-box protein [Rhodoferax lacus]
MARPAQRLVLYPVPMLIALLCLAAGLAATVYFADAARHAAYDDARTHFLKVSDQLESDVQTQFNDIERVLNGLRGLYESSDDVSVREFRRFVESSDPHQVSPGFRGLGFIERVPRPELAAFVANMRRNFLASYEARTHGDKPDLFLVKYLEPLSRNVEAIGYDIGSDPQRRAAAESAMRSGQATLTPRISLLQDSLKRPGFLLLLPIYAGASEPDSQDSRVRDLLGWAFAPVVLSELMASGAGVDVRLVNYQLFDAPDLNAKSLLYDSQLPAGEVNAPESLTRQEHSAFSVVRAVLLGGQVLYLRTNSSPAFEQDFHPREHLKAAVLGSGLSVLGAMVLWLLMAGRARAVDLAQSMTHDLERLAMVAKRTSNAVYFADTQWRISWVNEGFTRMSGFMPEEAIGMRPSQLLHSPLADPQTPLIIDSQAEAGGRVEIQVLQRSKAGRDYYADLEVLPILDSKGRITGYLSVQSDITEVVQAKAALLLEKERAENILTATNVGTWESNMQTGEQRWNDRWSAMLGFSREEVVPGVDQFWQQRVHPVDRERLKQAMADCIAARTDSYACDVRALRKDGQWMWVLSRGKVMSRSPDGSAEWVGGIHTDISESKQVELNLRDLEAFLDRAGRIAGVGAWQLDLKTRKLVFSAQTCAIHGLPADYEPTEKTALDFYPEADRQRVVDAVKRAEKDGTSWDLVVEFRNVQGEQLWVRLFCEVGFDDSGPVRLMGAFQDVTKSYLSQLEVERSGALLRGAIEAINEAFVLYDPQDRLVLCNDKFRAINSRSSDLLTYGASFESIIRGGAERGQYLEALGRVDEWVEQRMAAHRSGNVSMEQQLQDGRWLKVIDQRMPDGHTVGFRVDITELKLATAAAELTSAQRGEEQKRMQSILEGTQVGTWEWNVQTGHSLYNEQYVGMLGYTLQELEPLGYDTFVRLVHPEDLAASAQKMQEHLRGESSGYEIEVRMHHKQGHWIWVLAKGKRAKGPDEGQSEWVYGTHMDITERKRAEQQLAQTMATLQNVLDSATAVGVVTLGLDHTVRVFNKGAENLLGYSAHELVGQQSADRFFELSELGALRETLELMLGHVPDLDEVFAHVVQTRDAQEWTLVRKNGTRFKASLIFSPMRDVQGAQEGHLAVIYDISRQKEYESSLREAMRLAEQSSVAKSQFLANMSHEIRTPMNAILGMLQLLRNTALNAQQGDYAEKAVGAARSLLGLLNDILDFSKVEAGKMQLNPEPFLLDGLLGDLSVILSSNLGAKNVDLVFDVDSAIPRELIGDAMRLKQILINLGGNAVKFTEKGEVVVRWTLLARTPERVKLGVAVVDTGIGIAPENQSRIFDAFTQAEANTTRRFGGTGLGLVISTRLIRLMGGELQLSSVLGQGSTFSFTLELQAADFQPAAPLLTVGPASRTEAAVRVLLVDDNPQALATSAAMMRGLGWDVTLAASGAQALDLLKADLAAQAAPWDALFVDAEMPDMDGWDTLRNVCRLYASRKPPLLILLSRQSRGALSHRTEREQELLNGLMVKPLTAAMFTRALEQARNGSGLQPTQPQVSPQRLHGMRVLLVEDNLINQQVAQELLSAQGARVTLADNGALGLDAIRSAQPPFDVVLMDLQMPVMDGLSATRLLRTDKRFAELPVIAMTANAMHSDREDCLTAGMNDHVGKPFDLNQLVQTLITHTRWVERTGPVGGIVRRRAQPSVVQPALVDAVQAGADGLEIGLALARMGGNRQLLQRAITGFVADARLLPERLDQCLHQGDLPALKRELHGFKGLSATVGAPALSAFAAEAEKHLQSPQGALAWQARAPELTALLGRYLPLLEDVAGQLGANAHGDSPAVGTVDTLELAPLRELLVALQTSDMVALELYAALRQKMGAGISQAMEPLDLAMADLEFEAAATECEKLLRNIDTRQGPVFS